jgi:transcription elongation factor S-II
MKEERSLKPETLPSTDRFTCPKCKHRDCVYHIMQIRSGDEGSTIFVMCNKCKHNWRINS